MATESKENILADLGIEVESEKKATLTQKQERIIAGFEDIQRFVEERGHLPAHGEDKDIFERIYAARLDQISKQVECRDLLADIDHQGLLGDAENINIASLEALDSEGLLTELGIDVEEKNDITNLQNVKYRAEIKAAEEIANRIKCDDFENFKPIFDAVQNDLNTGIRKTNKFRKDAGFLKSDIKKGQFFIIGGQVSYVDSVGEPIMTPDGRHSDARLRVIYSNGTESDMLLRSLQRALYKYEDSRLISEPSAGPLFSGAIKDGDTPSGTIYVLRSKSDNDFVSKNRKFVHKIGVTTTSIKQRTANAKLDPTFLMAEITVVATYKLFKINKNKFEKLIHQFFSEARLNIEIKDRFGNPFIPQEWFCAPLECIEEAIDRIENETIVDYYYDVKKARLKKLKTKFNQIT